MYIGGSMAYGVDEYPNPPEYHKEPEYDWNGDTQTSERIARQSDLDDDLDAEAEAVDDE
jgi:hypothetical protein